MQVSNLKVIFCPLCNWRYMIYLYDSTLTPLLWRLISRMPFSWFQWNKKTETPCTSSGLMISLMRNWLFDQWDSPKLCLAFAQAHSFWARPSGTIWRNIKILILTSWRSSLSPFTLTMWWLVPLTKKKWCSCTLKRRGSWRWVPSTFGSFVQALQLSSFRLTMLRTNRRTDKESRVPVLTRPMLMLHLENHIAPNPLRWRFLELYIWDPGEETCSLVLLTLPK